MNLNHITSILLLLSTGLVGAQTVPTAIAYQGRLTDASTAPVPDGTGYEIEVRLWSAPTGGTLLWGSRYTGVPLKSGAFNLILGSGGTPIPGATTTDLKAAFNAPTIHLGLTTTKSATGASLLSPSEILPRQQIFSTPYAFRAETAANIQTDGVLSSTIKDGEVKNADIATDAVNGAKIAGQSISNTHIVPGSIMPDRLSPTVSVFSQQQANGTSPQTAKRGWQKRELNTAEVSIGSGIVLDDATDQISLAAGVYEIHAEVPYYMQYYAGGVGSRHRAGIRRISDSAIHGLTAVSVNEAELPNRYVNAYTGGVLHLQTFVTVPSGTEAFELVHHIQDTIGGGSANGGVPEGADGTDAIRGFCGVRSSGSSLPEVYSRITIKRIQ